MRSSQLQSAGVRHIHLFHLSNGCHCQQTERERGVLTAIERGILLEEEVYCSTAGTQSGCGLRFGPFIYNRTRTEKWVLHGVWIAQSNIKLMSRVHLNENSFHGYV